VLLAIMAEDGGMYCLDQERTEGSWLSQNISSNEP